MAMEREEKMKLNRTLLRAIEILELLSRSKEGYTLTELSLIFDYPKSSVFDIIKTLVYKNMVVEDNQTGITKYKIGLASFLIGSSYLNNIDIVNIAKSNLIDFANKMTATTFMAVLDENMVTYIYKYESENSIITTANVGTRKSLHCAALGKAMLAYKSEEEINKIIDKIDFISYTYFTIKTKEKLIEELAEVRQRGYAKDDRENTLQQIAVAAPLFDHEGHVVAAISCVGFYESSIDLDDLGLLIKDVGKQISYKLGYNPQ